MVRSSGLVVDFTGATFELGLNIRWWQGWGIFFTRMTTLINGRPVAKSIIASYLTLATVVEVCPDIEGDMRCCAYQLEKATTDFNCTVALAIILPLSVIRLVLRAWNHSEEQSSGTRYN